MSQEKSSYQQIVKATSIFGGVQVINIIIQLVRSKLIAVLLGPAGMGMIGLFQTALSMVGSATNFGLNTSAVRDISEAHSSGDQNKIEETVSVFRKLVWLTGLLGVLVTAILSPLLSKMSFGNYNYTWAFLLLSVTLLFNQLGAEKLVILQAFRRLDLLAKSNIFSALAGLILSFPLYWYFRVQGIVPSLIVIAVSVYAVQYWYSNKVKISSASISVRETLGKGKPMLKMGFALALSTSLTVASSYVIRIFISNTGSLEDVGFYSAGFTIVGTYVGLVFTAMGTDFYPRLAAINKDVEQSAMLITQQAETALFILAPLIGIFMVFIDFITVLIYSKQFLPISELVHWSMLGVYFKSVSWSIAFYLLARADSKAFFWNELVFNLYILVFNFLGYYYLGLMGLGLSFLIGYFIYLLQMYFFCKKRYGLNIPPKIFSFLILFLLLGGVSFFVSTSLTGPVMYLTGSLLILVTVGFSLVFFNRRLQLVSLIKSKTRK